MAHARKKQVSVVATPSYHVVSRCVRRTFLFGCFENKDFSHRRQLIVERLSELAKVFCITISAFAIMSNHYHLVVRIQRQQAIDLDVYDVIRRWNALFRLPVLVERFSNDTPISAAETAAVNKIIETWRSRLYDLSWFMRCLNEHIARIANAEDQCTGRFWEGRFKSQALLDETAELQAMAYVDLNPIRADMAASPEESDYTSIQLRMSKDNNSPMKNLLRPFAGDSHQDNNSNDIPYNLIEYIQLVDWSGRQIHPKKRSVIAANLPPIFTRLNMQHHIWLQNCLSLESTYHRVIGPAARMQEFCALMQQKWLLGIPAAREAFG
jgi:REP element-mobilizing transposase RayT